MNMEKVAILLIILAGVSHGKFLNMKEIYSFMLCRTVAMCSVKNFFSMYIFHFIYSFLFLLLKKMFFPAAEQMCNATLQSSLCSLTTGGCVYIQTRIVARDHQLWFKKDVPESVTVFSVKKDRVKIQDAYKNRSEYFISNGTLKLTNVEREDSGQYRTEIYDPNGFLVEHMNLTMVVQGKSLKIHLLLQCIYD